MRPYCRIKSGILEDFFGRQGNAERQTLIGELGCIFKSIWLVIT